VPSEPFGIAAPNQHLRKDINRPPTCCATLIEDCREFNKIIRKELLTVSTLPYAVDITRRIAYFAGATAAVDV